MMKRAILAAAAIGLAFATPAFAGSCPKHMGEIDAALGKNPQLTAAQLSEVKKLRADGETFHKAGKHQESMDSLLKAKKMMGMM
jgi:hypothetical protein